MKNLNTYINESMSDTKMKVIGKLLNKISNKEIKTQKELDKIMKSIQCKRITKDCEPNENGDFNAGYNNGKYSFRVFIKDNKICNYTDL